ncbi:hypothetical protein HDU76_005643, partial [Blyttiomyces sp. JEL0837]
MAGRSGRRVTAAASTAPPKMPPGLINLPTEVIVNIILSLPMTEETYLALQQVCRLFRTAMELVPKLIQFSVSIREEVLPRSKCFTSVIETDDDFVECFEWSMEMLPNDPQPRQFLLLAVANFTVSGAAVPLDDSTYLQTFLRQLTIRKMFSKSAAPIDVRVSCFRFEFAFEVRAFCSQDEADEPTRKALMRFMQGINPYYVSTVWFPDLIDYIRTTRKVELLPNTKESLNSLSSMGDVELAVTCLEFNHWLDGLLFPSINGVSRLKHLRKLAINRQDVVARLDENLQSLDLPNLEEMT